jgi:hypothetical protein
MECKAYILLITYLLSVFILTVSRTRRLCEYYASRPLHYDTLQISCRITQKVKSMCRDLEISFLLPRHFVLSINGTGAGSSAASSSIKRYPTSNVRGSLASSSEPQELTPHSTLSGKCQNAITQLLHLRKMPTTPVSNTITHPRCWMIDDDRRWMINDRHHICPIRRGGKLHNDQKQ